MIVDENDINGQKNIQDFVAKSATAKCLVIGKDFKAQGIYDSLMGFAEADGSGVVETCWAKNTDHLPNNLKANVNSNVGAFFIDFSGTLKKTIPLSATPRDIEDAFDDFMKEM